MEGIRFLVVSLLISATLAYSLEGNWLMTDLDGEEVNLPTNVSEFVFREKEIMHRLVIETCWPLKYLVSVDQNSFYINVDSELVSDEGECSPEEKEVLTTVRKTLRKVLQF